MARLRQREMPKTRECFRCPRTVHTAATCQMGSPGKGSGAVVEPQLRGSGRKKEARGKEKRKEENMQSHDDLTPNPVIANIELRKNEKEQTTKK